MFISLSMPLNRTMLPFCALYTTPSFFSKSVIHPLLEKKVTKHEDLMLAQFQDFQSHLNPQCCCHCPQLSLMCFFKHFHQGTNPYTCHFPCHHEPLTSPTFI